MNKPVYYKRLEHIISANIKMNTCYTRHSCKQHITQIFICLHFMFYSARHTIMRNQQQYRYQHESHNITLLCYVT